MAKFCRNCGAPLEEGAEKCSACGASLTAPAAQPKQASETLNKVSDVINTIFCVVEKCLYIVAEKAGKAVNNAQANRAAKDEAAANGVPAVQQKDSSLNIVRLVIVVIMIVLCLIGAIQNLVMKHDVTINFTVSYDGEKEKSSDSGPIGDLADSDEFIGFIIVNVIWAVFNIAILVMAVLVILKVVKLANSDKLYKATALIGLVGDVVYMILYKICGSGSQSIWGAKMKYSVALTALAWIHVIVFGVAVVLQYLPQLMAKNATPAVEAAPETPAE